MRVTALATIAAMLIAYLAIIIWAFEHVADRYTPKLMLPFFRRLALWPLISLLILLVVMVILLLPPLPHLLLSFVIGPFQSPPWLGDGLSGLLLIISFVVVLLSGYMIVQYLANGKLFIPWLHEQVDRYDALQEILFKSMQRADQGIATSALQEALDGQESEREKFLVWFMENQDLLATDWLIRDLPRFLLPVALDEKSAQLYKDFLNMLLEKALDNNSYSSVRIILKTLLQTLEKAKVWTKAHSDLLYLLGFTIWKEGEPGRCILRQARISYQLEEIQSIFIDGVNTIWQRVSETEDLDAVEAFTLVLKRLAMETLNERLPLHSLIEYSYKHHLITSQKIQEIKECLCDIIRSYNHLDEINRSKLENMIDNLFIDLAVMLVELEGNGENAYYFLTPRNTVNRTSQLKNKMSSNNYHQHSWLKKECYQVVAEKLGVHNFKYVG